MYTHNYVIDYGDCCVLMAITLVFVYFWDFLKAQKIRWYVQLNIFKRLNFDNFAQF